MADCIVTGCKRLVPAGDKFCALDRSLRDHCETTGCIGRCSDPSCPYLTSDRRKENRGS